MVRSIGGVTLERTHCGIDWVHLASRWKRCSVARKNTCCSRSFGKPVTGLVELEEAVANYAVRAIRKVRAEGSLACGIQVFVMTNRFREDQAQYSNARALSLDEPTDDPIRVIRRAKELLRAIYRPGYSYKKAGIILLDLVSSEGSRQQGLLFEEFGDDRTRGFVDAVEEVAARYGTSGWVLGVLREWIIPGGCAGKCAPRATPPTGRRFLRVWVKQEGNLSCPSRSKRSPRRCGRRGSH